MGVTREGCVHGGEGFAALSPFGGINDSMAAAGGGVYVSGLAGGVYDANPKGVVSRFGQGIRGNGIILSPDE